MGMELWLDAALLGVLGLLVGSFLNVVIYRLPKMLERQWGVLRFNLYYLTGVVLMDIAALLIGGASVTRASIPNVIAGVILFHHLFLQGSFLYSV